MRVSMRRGEHKDQYPPRVAQWNEDSCQLYLLAFPLVLSPITRPATVDAFPSQIIAATYSKKCKALAEAIACQVATHLQ